MKKSKSSASRALEHEANSGKVKAAFELSERYREGRFVEENQKLSKKYASIALDSFKNQSLQILSMKLVDFRGFQSLELNFRSENQSEQNLMVLVGINGAGKTTILDAISKSLSWLKKRIRSQSGNGEYIKDIDIRNTSEYASIVTSLSLLEDLRYEFELSKAVEGNKASRSNSLVAVQELANLYKLANQENPNFNFPIMASYSVDRSIEINNKDHDRLSETSLYAETKFDGYDNSLKGTADFISFFKWFKQCEEIEKFEKGKAKTQAAKYIKFTLGAIESFMPSIKNLRIQRSPVLDMLADKESTTLSILQLSQGEKSLLALITDITRRLVLLNPSLENPLEGCGIVLIDEIELHLHPAWQQKVVPSLLRTFPNIQFIITTHSPQVLTTVESDCIRVLNDWKSDSAPEGTKGAEPSRLLKRILGVEPRPIDDEYTALLSEYESLVYDDKWELQKAKEMRIKLDEIFSNQEPKLTELDLYIENREWELSIEKDQ